MQFLPLSKENTISLKKNLNIFKNKLTFQVVNKITILDTFMYTLVSYINVFHCM